MQRIGIHQPRVQREEDLRRAAQHDGPARPRSHRPVTAARNDPPCRRANAVQAMILVALRWRRSAKREKPGRTERLALPGYTSGGAPYGIYLDEMDDDYLIGMISPGRPEKLSTSIYSVCEYRHRSVLTSHA